jgi:RNA polymerase sigma factor (sigma-70 family)
MPVNIFIADDQRLVRQGIRSLLEDKCDVDVVGEATNGFECLNEVSKINPNIVILDVDMTGMNGIDTLKIMKEQGFSSKTLMIADDKNSDSVLTAVELGCDGYIIKDCDVSILKKAIYTIYDGDRYIQPELQEQLEKSIELKTDITDKLNELTRREIEVLKLLAEGMFNKEIAVKLHISERTVKNHVSNLFKKIKVNDRTQAAVFAIKNSLI